MNLNLHIKKINGHDKGFTLLELLIVVSIIAILSVALIVVLNPAEALKKSRDSQRMSDLAALKTALGLYLTSTSTPYLGGKTDNNGCKATPTAVTGNRIYYSTPSSVVFTGTINDGYQNGAASTTVATTTLASTDGNGWIPVNFDSLTGGSPISNLPIDPVNTVASAGPTVSDLVYRYECSVTPLAFEIDATLESIAYASSSPTTDGGNNGNYYEVGTNLKILGNGTAF